MPGKPPVLQGIARTQVLNIINDHFNRRAIPVVLRINLARAPRGHLFSELGLPVECLELIDISSPPPESLGWAVGEFELRHSRVLGPRRDTPEPLGALALEGTPKLPTGVRVRLPPVIFPSEEGRSCVMPRDFGPPSAPGPRCVHPFGPPNLRLPRSPPPPLPAGSETPPPPPPLRPEGKWDCVEDNEKDRWG